METAFWLLKTRFPDIPDFDRRVLVHLPLSITVVVDEYSEIIGINEVSPDVYLGRPSPKEAI